MTAKLLSDLIFFYWLTSDLKRYTPIFWSGICIPDGSLERNYSTDSGSSLDMNFKRLAQKWALEIHGDFLS